MDTHLLEGGIAALGLLLSGIVGYFRMYLLLADRLTKLERHRELTDERLENVKATLDSVDGKLDRALTRIEQNAMTLYGVDGTNGLRSRVAHLETKTDDARDRSTHLESKD